MLRGLAVSLVCLCHAGVPFLSGGFVGVDVFFVLSGYLISGLLISEFSERGSINYGAFIGRRLRRLLPALAVMILAVLAVASQLLSGFEFQSQTGAAGYAAIWASNLFFALRELDYFNALESDDLFLHTWSLGVEEQFYLLWPLLIAVAMLLSVRRGSDAAGQHRALVAWFLLLAVASLALSFVWTATRPLWAFYMMPTRVWQFALGGLVFLHAVRLPTNDSRRRFNATKGMLGIGLILGSSVLLDTSVSYPGGWALMPSVGAALVLLSNAPTESPQGNAGLAERMLVWLGDRSYSIYLWHWPVLVLGAVFVARMSPVNTAAALLVTVLLAAASYRYVELPFWKGRFNRSGHRKVAVASLAAIGAVSVAAFTAAVVVPTGTAVTTWPADYDPRRDEPPIYGADMPCDTWHLDDEVVPCAAGAADAPRTAVLFGDSIGAQWVSMLPAIYSQPDWQIVVLTKSACPIVDEDYVYSRIGEVYSVCASWRDSAVEHIVNMKPDVVFVGSDAYYPFDDQQWLAGSRRIIDQLRQASGDVVIIQATPTLGFDGPSCLREPAKFARRAAADGQACTVPFNDSVVANVGEMLRSVAGEFPNVHELSLLDLVCPDGYCAAGYAQDGVVFRDDRHVTNSFVEARVPQLMNKLASLGIDP